MLLAVKLLTTRSFIIIHSRDAVGVDGTDTVDIVVVVGVHGRGGLEVGDAHHRTVVVCRCH